MAEEWQNEKQIDMLKDKYLIFYLSERAFAIEICYVAEIIGIQKITPLPHEAESIKGVINLRGRVIPVMDARLRLGLEERAYDDRTCIVICKVRETSVGVVVDTVSEVVNITSEQIEDPPQLQKSKQTPYLQGLAKTANDVKVVLNMENFLFAEELAGFEAIEAEPA